MSDNNLFNIDDIFDDNKSKADFAALIGVIIRLVLAVTTGGFFFIYVGELFAWLAGPLYSPYLSAVTGVFCIDGLAYFWSKLRQRSGNTETQLTAATIGTIGNILISVLVTVVFIILLTDFVAIYDSAGSLNDIGQAVNIAGLLIATIAIGGNGVLWAYFDANSAAVRQALSAARLAAARFAGQFAIDDRRNRLEIGRTIEELHAALPRYTNDAARRNRAQYLLNNFNDLDADGNGRLDDREIHAAWAEFNRARRSGKPLHIYRKPPRGTKVNIKTARNFKEGLDYIWQNSRDHDAGTLYWMVQDGFPVCRYKVGRHGDLEQVSLEGDRHPSAPISDYDANLEAERITRDLNNPNGRPTPPQRFE